MDTRGLFFILSLLAITSVVSASLGRKSLAASYKPIENLNDPHIIAIAKFAVMSKLNKKGKAELEFIKVVKGALQVVGHTNYNYALVISAKNGADVHSYATVVYENPKKHYLRLTAFKALLH